MRSLASGRSRSVRVLLDTSPSRKQWLKRLAPVLLRADATTKGGITTLTRTLAQALLGQGEWDMRAFNSQEQAALLSVHSVLSST